MGSLMEEETKTQISYKLQDDWKVSNCEQKGKSLNSELFRVRTQMEIGRFLRQLLAKLIEKSVKN